MVSSFSDDNVVFDLIRFSCSSISPDGLYEKNVDSLSITGNEISFKFPLDDVICTIDDMILSTPSKPTLKSFTKQG